MGDVVANGAQVGPPKADANGLARSEEETGFRPDEPGVGEESFDDASDSSLGQEVEALLSEMRKAITDLGLSGDAYKGPDLMRFLRARSNNVKKASKLFVDHENFRKTFCPKGYISEDEVANELAAKKATLQGLDKEGHPLSIGCTKYHIAAKRDLEEFKRFLVYSLDKIIAAMPPGVEQFVSFLDLTGIGYSNLDSAALRHIFDFLQGYYPERLSKLYFLNAPFIFGTIWKVVSPFIDARTRKKIIFCTTKNLADTFLPHVDLKIVPAEYGGSGSFIYIQDYYVPGYAPDEEKRAKPTQASSVSV
ncbi:Sec14p-like phosphatidylinositol transfer family protein [Klebsormidium nitens]|uniref:Sec14p-like phosphatidylinositol transfer family protein n=1 Tax=Klebsormidium nitens TaxID=105231 RepID=A0A1Y1I4L4_KLENI|nr:Sec14p-like phosphatidylinositol transfer family protein [Klebsormidium nitens]|eukprot:GAQ85884.1 Sec14p-like phosphatidylinositol transfer family protein [Klebsormidium nitens]